MWWVTTATTTRKCNCSLSDSATWATSATGPLSWDSPGKVSGVGCHSFLSWIIIIDVYCSVSRVMSDTSQPHELQHAGCPSPSLQFAQLNVHGSVIVLSTSLISLTLLPLAVVFPAASGCYQWVSCLHAVASYWSFWPSLPMPCYKMGSP